MFTIFAICSSEMRDGVVRWLQIIIHKIPIRIKLFVHLKVESEARPSFGSARAPNVLTSLGRPLSSAQLRA